MVRAFFTHHVFSLELGTYPATELDIEVRESIMTTHTYDAQGKRRKTQEYGAFCNAKSRCKGQQPGLYLEKGIKFCFTSFGEFLESVGERPSNQHTLERINNGGHYEDGNVEWATWSDQSRNKDNNVFLSYNGEYKCLRDWSQQLNISEPTLSVRHSKGWCDMCVLTVPVGTKGHVCCHI